MKEVNRLSFQLLPRWRAAKSHEWIERSVHSLQGFLQLGDTWGHHETLEGHNIRMLEKEA